LHSGLHSEEHSGIESDKLSEILEITVSGGNIVNSQIVQAQGQQGFWTTAPESPSDFTYSNLSEAGQYNLTWTEPNDGKVRYYNIYYSNESNPSAEQRYRIASIIKGISRYYDLFADNSTSGYYGITSVDRYGNEGQIVYATQAEISSPGLFGSIMSFFEVIIDFIIGEEPEVEEEPVEKVEEPEIPEEPIEEPLEQEEPEPVIPEDNQTIINQTDCTDNDGDGYNISINQDADCGPLDCNDNNENIRPLITELCDNLIDDDCDELIDCDDNDCSENNKCNQEPTNKIPEDYIAYWKFDNSLIDEVSNQEARMYTWVDPVFIDGKAGKSVLLNPGIHKDYSVVISKQYDLSQGYSYLIWFNVYSFDNRTWNGHSLIRDWTNEYNHFDFGFRSEYDSDHRLRTWSKKSGNSTVLLSPFYPITDFPYKDTWTHAAYIWNKTHEILFINGEVIDMKFNDNSFSGNSGIYLIGQKLNGSVDEAMVYDRGLSEQEVKAIYCNQGGSGSFC